MQYLKIWLGIRNNVALRRVCSRCPRAIQPDGNRVVRLAHVGI